MNKALTTVELQALFEGCLTPHLDFLPAILDSGRKDLVQAAVLFASVLKQDRFDSQIMRLIVHNEYFQECLQVLAARPKATYLSVILKSWERFPVKNQEKLLPLVWSHGNREEGTAFLMQRFEKLDTTVRVRALEALVRIGIEEGRYFAFKQLQNLSPSEQLDILGVLFECEFVMDYQTTKEIIELFQSASAIDIRAAYLRLLAKGDPELSLKQLTECLQRQPEIITSAAFDALLQLGLHEQIPENFLQQYSNSKFYRLATNVARVYGRRWKISQDRDSLAQGMRILSWLLNDDSADAKLAAIDGAEDFHSDPRVFEWIGSLLLSEADEDILRSAFAFLKRHPASPAQRGLLLKACERSLPVLQQMALELLCKHSDSSLIPFYLELIHKEKNRNPAVACQAIDTLSRCIRASDEDEAKYFALFSEDSLELQRAVISGMQSWRSESSRRLLEKEYQNCTGLNKSLAAFVLFQKGVTYILDDLFDLLASENAQDQKMSLTALTTCVHYMHETEPVTMAPELLTNLELWHSQVTTRREEESVIRDFDIKLMLPLRQLILAEKYEDALLWMDKKADPDSNWFLTLTKIWLRDKLGDILEPETLLQLTERAPECAIGHDLLLIMYRKLRRKSEYVHHQLQLLEMKHKLYGDLLACLNELPKESYETPVFLNILKLIQTAGLPNDGSMHSVLSAIFIKIKRYDLALEHLCFGYFTNSANTWFVELASCFYKLGRKKEARQACRVAYKLALPPNIVEKLYQIESRLTEGDGKEQ